MSVEKNENEDKENEKIIDDNSNIIENEAKTDALLKDNNEEEK